MKANEVKKILGVTQNTLNNYIKQGKLRYTAINPYHYIYNEDDVYRLLGGKKPNKHNVTYSRVSLPKQKEDLKSQRIRLLEYSNKCGIKIEKEFSDIKSGMNFKDRKDFNKLLNDVVEGKISNVIIENKDRLARFGFELLEKLFKTYNTNIVVVNNASNLSYEDELTQDLISIIHHFSMKSYSNRRKLNKIKRELREE
jgi:predicted site-specific integrase-resolvase